MQLFPPDAAHKAVSTQGLVHRSDADSQSTSIHYSARLSEANANAVDQVDWRLLRQDDGRLDHRLFKAEVL